VIITDVARIIATSLPLERSPPSRKNGGDGKILDVSARNYSVECSIAQISFGVL
jgi:hypothetical protein